MSRKILVSLVSEQTVPNVELIKDMYSQVDALLFISTDFMEKNGNREWILNALRNEIELPEILPTIIVDAFSFSDIEEKLNAHIKDENDYVVNLTGGTKVMSLAVHDFFKNVSSEMYYLTGRRQYIKVHPGRSRPVINLKSKLNLREYMEAYGFNITNTSEPLRDSEHANRFLDYFLNSFDNEKDPEILNYLRGRRGRNTSIKEVEGLPEFLGRVGFEEDKPDKLNKYESKYLTGDWLEEYLYYFLKKNHDVYDNELGLSWNVNKNDNPNEFDVLVMKNNKLYVFECKTSIYLDSDESQTFIGETIYKSDSLRNKLGLFAQTIIFTLSDLSKPKLKSHILRAEASRVKLIGRDIISNDKKLIEFFKKL